MKSIKIIHIEQDNQIDYMICSECGASLKHAMIIDQQVFGLDCGAKKLGWNTSSKARINHKVIQMEQAAAHFKAIMSSNLSKSWKEIDAGRVCELFGLPFKRTDPDFLNQVLNSIQ